MSALLAPDALALQSLINFLARKKLYHQVYTAAHQGLTKRANDPVLLFWKAYALLKEGKTSDAIRELEALRGKNGVQLPVLMCLKTAHESSRLVDREAVQQINQDIFREEKANKDGSLFVAAAVCMLSGDNKKGREYIGKVMEIQANYPQARSMAGWIELTSGSEIKARKSLDLFKAAQEASEKDMDAVLGRAQYYEQMKDVDSAIEELNKCVVAFSWFTPALSEKARILLAKGDWDQAIDAANRSLTLAPNNIEALRLTTLHLMAKDSRPADAAKRLAELAEVLEEEEPNNPRLYYETSALFARFCARAPATLTMCMQLVKKACDLDPTNSEYMTEMGHQQMLAGKVDDANRSYKTATTLDEANMRALYGTIRGQIIKGELDDAAGQFEFLNEIHSGTNASSDLCYIGALIARDKDKDSEKTVQRLEETVNVHMEACGDDTFSIPGMIKLDPDFLLTIARELLELAGTEPGPQGEPPPTPLAKAVRVLQPVATVAPGLLEVQLLLARARYLSRDFEGAQQVLSEAIRADPTHCDMHMLMSQIFLEMGRFREASAALEQALSHNFEIRESPTYYLLRALVHEKSGQWAEALKVLESAMNLPGVKGGTAPGKAPLKQSDRANIFLHLAMAHAELDHAPEASKIIQDATREFRGTPQAAHIVIVNSQLALRRGDVQAALVMLKGVSSDSPHYLKAKIATANIHLNHRHDRKLYLKCFEELVDRNESVTTLCMLADAYMQTQNPDKAVECYQRALKLSPNESDLAGKIGQALVSTHDFNQAIRYYEEAVKKQPTRYALALALAELYMKLGKAGDAVRTLDAMQAALGGGESVEGLMVRSKAQLLTSQLHKKEGAMEEYAKALGEARATQGKILGRLRGEAADMIRDQRKAAASICSELAQYYEGLKNYPETLRFYGEALKHDERHTHAMVALARLHMDREELEEARQYCTQLIKYDLQVETATMLLADIMFRSNEFEEAIGYFATMLDTNATNYKALEQLILLVRRAGRLTEAPRFLSKAEKSSTRATLDAGLHFCKGLYARYTRNFHEALSELNQSRKDGEWGTKAVCHMIEIYLDPESLGEECTAASPINDKNKMAKQLRMELTSVRQVKLMLFEGYEMLISLHKPTVEASVNKFSDVLNIDKDSVDALLGMSYALRLLKQEPKARNHLKRISKMQYNTDEAEELERSYLLLADMYIQSNKNDLAQELCRKCLTHNKSCAKAWEYQGLIFEKEASYADAAQVYEMAWQFDNKRNPAVGFKLAFNYLKARRFVEAINICNEVLRVQPNYPKIRLDILAKAQASIRL